MGGPSSTGPLREPRDVTRTLGDSPRSLPWVINAVLLPSLSQPSYLLQKKRQADNTHQTQPLRWKSRHQSEPWVLSPSHFPAMWPGGGLPAASWRRHSWLRRADLQAVPAAWDPGPVRPRACPWALGARERDGSLCLPHPRSSHTPPLSWVPTLARLSSHPDEAAQGEREARVSA